MISIKMFYYLLRFNCVLTGARALTAQRWDTINAIRMPKMHSIPFFDAAATISRTANREKKRTAGESPRSKLRHAERQSHTKCAHDHRNKEAKKKEQSHYTFIWLFSQRIQMPNMVKTHYGWNCTHKYRIHVNTVLLCRRFWNRREWEIQCLRVRCVCLFPHSWFNRNHRYLLVTENHFG